MRTLGIATLVLVEWLTIVHAPAMASNYDFLREAPGTFFNEADQASFLRATTAALNEANDGETRSWSNAETRSSGEIQVIRTLPGESRCREAQITNRAAGRSHTQRTVFCYDAGKDRWTMRPGR
jgi:surface antigen